METIRGKFAEAIVYADDLEQYARAQLQMICDNAVSKDSKIRVMPDVHPGKVGTIGLTMTITDRVIPNLLSIDIGCGVSCMKISDKRIELEKLDKVVRERIPAGYAVRDRVNPLAEDFDFAKLRCVEHIRTDKALLSLGTLGGGNHFIEADKGENGTLYLTVHTGSRHLGKEVTEYYIKRGAELLKVKGKEIPYELTYLEGEFMADYLADVQVLQEYAALNRKIILREIAKGMKFKEAAYFSSEHNYVGMSNGEMILRKGAISAEKGEKVIIPINMRDGIILGMGKGNPEWNFSAPHGSGRRFKRDEVKNYYTVSAFKKEMMGIYSSCVGADTLDEAPFAYRDIDRILSEIGETVEVIEILKPVYNFKAGDRR